MANNPSDAPADDFLEQILGLPTFASTDSGLAGTAAPPPMMLQLNSGDGTDHLTAVGAGGGSGAFHAPVYQLGLSLEQGKGGFLKPEEASGSGKRFREDILDSRAKNVRQVLLLFLCFCVRDQKLGEMNELIFTKEHI